MLLLRFMPLLLLAYNITSVKSTTENIWNIPTPEIPVNISNLQSDIDYGEYDRVEFYRWNIYDASKPLIPVGNLSLRALAANNAMDTQNCAKRDCNRCVVGIHTRVVINAIVQRIVSITIFPGKKAGPMQWYDCQTKNDPKVTCTCELGRQCDGSDDYCENHECMKTGTTSCYCQVKRNEIVYSVRGETAIAVYPFAVSYYACVGEKFEEIEYYEDDDDEEDLDYEYESRNAEYHNGNRRKKRSAYIYKKPERLEYRAPLLTQRMDPTVLNASQEEITVNLNPQNLPATMILRKSGLEEKIIVEQTNFVMRIPMELQLEGGILQITLIVPDGHFYKMEVYLRELELCERIQCLFCVKMLHNIHCLPESVQYGFYASLVLLTLLMVYYIKMALLAIYFVGTAIIYTYRGTRFIIRSIMGKGVTSANRFTERCTSFMGMRAKPEKTPDMEVGDIRTMIREHLEEISYPAVYGRIVRRGPEGRTIVNDEREIRSPMGRRSPPPINSFRPIDPYKPSSSFQQEIYAEINDPYDSEEPHYKRPLATYSSPLATYASVKRPNRQRAKVPHPPSAVTVLVVMLLLPLVLPCNDHKISQSKVEHCEKNVDGEICRMKLNVGITLKNLGARSCLWLTDENANPITRIELEFEKVDCTYTTELQYFTAPCKIDSMLVIHCSQNEYCGWGHNCVGGARFQEKDSDRVVNGEEIYYSPLFTKESTQYPGRTECKGHVVGTPMCGIKHYSPCLFYRYWFIPVYERVYKVSKITGRQCESTIIVTEGLAEENQTTYRIRGQRNLLTETGIEIDLQGTYAQGESYFRESLVVRAGNASEGYLIEASPASQPRSHSIGDIQAETPLMKTFIYDQNMVSCKFYHEQMRCRKPDSVITNMFVEQ